MILVKEAHNSLAENPSAAFTLVSHSFKLGTVILIGENNYNNYIKHLSKFRPLSLCILKVYENITKFRFNKV